MTENTFYRLKWQGKDRFDKKVIEYVHEYPTIERALRAVDNLEKLDEFENIELFRCIELEEKLEDKTTPKKPTPHGDGTNFRCPSCGNCMLTSNNRQPYSMCCGQLLNWEEYMR